MEVTTTQLLLAITINIIGCTIGWIIDEKCEIDSAPIFYTLGFFTATIITFIILWNVL